MRPPRAKSRKINRREFFVKSAIGGIGLPLLSFSPQSKANRPPRSVKAPELPESSFPTSKSLNLAPAHWIWFPSGRTLCNTVVLFRRQIKLTAPVKKAVGWIVADSRYRLFVNGKRIQWGPAPSDPRWVETDPLDLASSLHEGENVVGVEVLYFGLGDGTYPIGKPGFIFKLQIEHSDGSTSTIVSDEAWRTHLARSWRPGQYKRWYVRAFQEEFDARLYPFGWLEAGFKDDRTWLAPIDIGCPPDKPTMCATYPEYALEVRGTKEISELRPRSIPLMDESMVAADRLAESLWINWLQAPEMYFDTVAPNCFEAIREPSATTLSPSSWKADLDGVRAAALTFEFKEQIVGWPCFTVDAPSGTIVEMMVQESHVLGGPPLLNTQFHAWTRFICKEGMNRFETFDFESCRWVQLHIRNAKGTVIVRDVALRRRVFPWPHQPAISCSEPGLHRLFQASINTLNNCAQETAVDGMARERQQYSGDGSHQLHGVFYAFGETRLPARFVTTFSQGSTLDGYFLDCWPAYDRLARLMERQVNATFWGPLLDHGIGFNFDCWHHYLYTGNLEEIREAYPRLLKFFKYLQSIRGDDGLLPVENLGVPSVWIDHDAFKLQRHKQCPFNLYAAAMLEHALAPLCKAFGDSDWEKAAKEFGRGLLKNLISKFWDGRQGLFVDNLPWIKEEKGVRTSDRSLATAVLFDQCPRGMTSPCLRSLAETPPEMGFSYPANAGWRLWALAKGGRADVILHDLRTRWATMDSVRLNNTLQETWKVLPDSTAQWSHCPIAPLYVLYMSIAGIKPLLPGFRKYELVPQFADIPSLDLTAHTVRGPITISTRGLLGKRDIEIQTPAGAEGEVSVDARESVALTRVAGIGPLKRTRYRLPAGEKVTLSLKYT